MPLSDRDFCPAHRAHLTYLHDVRLEHIKASQWSVSPSASWDENVEAYNELQETIALRNMISELLYPENPNAGHWNAESGERDNRDRAGRIMGRWVLQRREARVAADSATNTAAGTAAMPSFPPAATSSAPPTCETTGTDPAVPEDVGRRSLRYYMTENLSIARSRETNPTKMFLWELLVNFDDIKELERRVARNRLMLGSGPGPVSVMEFFDPLDGDRLIGNAEEYVQPGRAHKTTEPEVDEFGDIIPPDSPPVVAPVRSPPTPPPAPPPPPTTGREFDDLLDERARSKKDLPPLPGLVEEPPKQEWRWVYGHLDWGSAEMDERTERLYGKW
ncbi:uncharacterized protein C8A04DRAFT_33026 [Dichotomopilus funicola]|uniref:Uncharacterized protein n=1 Tax=Dichotomopilus funicola TaxID=1934379 RepID=A0AAN6UVS4_9PEZI|nr:hypothetical protein C8A04DRAFT_33026 [Dichotomopilus funicola]